MENSKTLQLKKKLFVLAGYLFITAILLVYVSYSSYKIKITTTVRMPKTYTINAAIGLRDADDTTNNNLVSEASIELENYSALVGLAPGNSAETYAASDASDVVAKNHMFSVRVTNIANEFEDPDAEDDTISKLGLIYSLKVETSGRLPLKFVLKDDATGEKYTATVTMDHVNNYATAVFKTSGGAIAEFSLSSSAVCASGSINEHNIYIGWDEKEKDSSIDLCREVDKIRITAVVRSDVPDYQAPETPPQPTRLEEEGGTEFGTVVNPPIE